MNRRAGAGPYPVIVTGAACGLALIMAGVSPVVGVPITGGFFLLGALLRLALPERRAGLLAIRGRTTDVVTLGLIGALLVFGGLILLVPRHLIIG